MPVYIRDLKFHRFWYPTGPETSSLWILRTMSTIVGKSDMWKSVKLLPDVHQVLLLFGLLERRKLQGRPPQYPVPCLKKCYHFVNHLISQGYCSHGKSQALTSKVLIILLYSHSFLARVNPFNGKDKEKAASCWLSFLRESRRMHPNIQNQ